MGSLNYNLKNYERDGYMAENNNGTIFSEIIQNGVNKRIVSLNGDKSKITYHVAEDYTTSFKNPEEKVRGAYFVELVDTYKYPTNRIKFEVTVPRRTPSDRADIVVYEDDECKKPFLIVECKKDGITDAEFRQAIEQAFGNANSIRGKLAIVVAGTTRTAFDVAGFKPNEREKNVISDIPIKYGKIPKYKFFKGVENKGLKIVPREDLIKVLDKAHDTVWQGGKLAPTTAFDEISKLLFCKLQEEKERTITKKGEPYKFQIGTHESAEEVFKRVDSIYQNAKLKDAEVFKEDIRLEPNVVYSVVEHLQSINFNETDLDTKGVAFERFMTDFFKGKMGQFFTPREVIRFAVKMLNPQENQNVLDPACGSGGFLLNSMDNVRELANDEYGEHPEGQDAVRHFNMWHGFAEKNLFGIEINDQIARVCKMNMIIHDDGHSNVINTDALKEMKDIAAYHKEFKKNKFDIILTNPPFGASVKKAEHPYLDKFELGKDKKNQKTEILFIERCIEFLKPGTGKMGIVLPDGILTNSSLQYVRDFLMKHCEIEAVVSIPSFAFSHYGAGVKSSVVFVRKKGTDEDLGNYPIFMAIADNIGYDATGRKDSKNDLFDVDENDRVIGDTGILGEFRKFQADKNNYEGC